MKEATQILKSIEQGIPQAAEQLLPLVYEELRKLAAARLVREPDAHTMQATALVHEAWLRLIGPGNAHWNSRGHFFGAAGEAMRRILVENARRKRRQQKGMERYALDLHWLRIASSATQEQLIAVDNALAKLEARDPEKAKLVKLRFFVGLNHEEVAEAMGLSLATVKRHWTYAKAWLYDEMRRSSQQGESSPP